MQEQFSINIWKSQWEHISINVRSKLSKHILNLLCLYDMLIVNWNHSWYINVNKKHSGYIMQVGPRMTFVGSTGSLTRWESSSVWSPSPRTRLRDSDIPGHGLKQTSRPCHPQRARNTPLPCCLVGLTLAWTSINVLCHMTIMLHFYHTHFTHFM